MENKKNRPIGMRLLLSVAAFLLIGSIVYILIAGINLYSGVILASAVLGLGIPSVSSGESVMEMIADFFELLIDGIVDAISGIIDAITSSLS